MIGDSCDSRDVGAYPFPISMRNIRGVCRFLSKPNAVIVPVDVHPEHLFAVYF